MKYLNFNDYCLDETRLYIADLSLVKEGHNSVHKHNFYEMFMVIKGEFNHIKNGTTECVKAKDFQILKPDDEHQFIGLKDVNILRNIAIEKSYFESLFSEHDLDVNIEALIHVNDVIYQNFLYKTDLILSKSYSNLNYVLESLIQDIIIELIVNKNHDQGVPRWLKKAREAMTQREHFLEGLPCFVALSGVSQEHLTRELKRYYDETPTQFINNLRVLEAASQLTLTETSIIEIAFDCGFDNISHFNRLFKKKFNVTPRTYRKNNKMFFS